MATAADLETILELGKKAGLTGPELAAFMREERAQQREEAKLRFQAEATAKKAERQVKAAREEREAAREEREANAREAQKQREHELALAAAGGTRGRPSEGASVPKLPLFDEKQDDMDAYLHRYEGYATAQG